MGTRTGNAAWQDYPSTATLITAAKLEAIETTLDEGAGKNWMSGIWCLPGVALNTSISNESTSAATLYMVPFYVASPGSVTDIAINVGTAGTAATSARLGIFSKDATGSQWSRVNDAGTVSIATTGDKTLTGLSIALPEPGLYGVAVLCESACSLNSRSAGLPIYGPQSGSPFSTNAAVFLSAAQAYGALPATISPTPGGGFTSSFHRAIVKLS